MMKIPRRTTIAVALVLGAAAPAGSQQPPPIGAPVQPVVPQFNNPGPQIVIPKPGNPVEQLSPIPSLKPPAGVLPSSSNSGRARLKHRRARM